MSQSGPNTTVTSALSAPSIFDGERFLSHHSVLLSEDTVVAVTPISEVPADVEHLSLDDGTLAPGFIDLQVNGGGDVMFNTAPTVEGIEAITRAHRSRGTTGLLPTLVSDTLDIQMQAAEAIEQARRNGNQGVLGLHIEGPFFAREKRGAHALEKLREMSAADIDWLCSQQGFPVLLTLAPEVVTTAHLRRLAKAGLHICAGHTNADYGQLCEAKDAGLSGVTHLFNAMGGVTSREPGTLGAALDLDELWAGIIADGHHVHAAGIRLAYKAKPRGKLILVSDAMPTVGGKESAFEMHGEAIQQKNGKLINADGNLAGSAIGLIDAVAFAHREAGLPLEECLRMASLYPSAILGLAGSLGSITPGCRADFAHFDDTFCVRNTWLAGMRLQH
jgi:N-acetylglucosamine-6-phosphate deacetylase